jgi:hypothetical protein
VTLDVTTADRELAPAPLDEKADHVRGSAAGHLIIEYGDYECPYSRQAFHAIEQVEQRLDGRRPPWRLGPAHPASCATARRPGAGDKKPRRSLTMIAVTRPGVITLLMMRMLFTPLGTP